MGDEEEHNTVRNEVGAVEAEHDIAGDTAQVGKENTSNTVEAGRHMAATGSSTLEEDKVDTTLMVAVEEAAEVEDVVHENSNYTDEVALYNI